MSEHEINFFGFHEENTIADVRKVFSCENPLAKIIGKCIPQFVYDKKWQKYGEKVKMDLRTCFYEILFKLILRPEEYNIYLGCRNIADDDKQKWIQEYGIEYIVTNAGWLFLLDYIHPEPDCLLSEFRDMIFNSIEKLCQNDEFLTDKKWYFQNKDDYKKVFTASAFRFPDLSTPFSHKIRNCLQSKKSLILTGAPGTGKTYHVKEYVDYMTGSDKSRQKLVQFHPSYDYTDFVEGLRPAVVGYDEHGKPVTQFVRMDGQFKALCRKAAKAAEVYNTLNVKNDYVEPLRRQYCYYFIIDEINRAELSRVFGELMYCMEYRSQHIETQYHNLPTYVMGEDGIAVPIENDVFAEGFYIPENVYIIGTMNDIDRSVDSFDFALRRRFEWYEVKAEDTMKDALRELYDKDVLDDIAQRAKKLNAYIATEGESFGLSDAYHLGQAYFRDYAAYDNPGKYFDDKLESILFEYVRGRKDKKDFLEGARKAFCAELTEDRNAPED